MGLYQQRQMVTFVTGNVTDSDPARVARACGGIWPMGKLPPAKKHTTSQDRSPLASTIGKCIFAGANVLFAKLGVEHLILVPARRNSGLTLVSPI